jgi:spore coat polysaccharide biosynthesis predicted glycosyltransferase SpsG
VLVEVSGKMPDLADPSIEPCSWRTDSTVLDETLEGVDVAFIDSYVADSALYTRVAQRVSVLVAFDDFNRIPYPVDLVVNPNPHADQLDYSGQNADVIGGSDFVVLRPELLPLHDEFEVRDRCRNLFVTVGGDDYRLLLPKLLPRLAKRHYQLQVVGAAKSADLRSEYASYENVFVHEYLTASEMASQMTRADVTISAGGQTLHELAFLGVPTIGICIDDDQEGNVEFYNQAGFLPTRLDWDLDDLAGRVLKDLENLHSREARQKRSRIGKALVDGKGPERIRGAVFDKL